MIWKAAEAVEVAENKKVSEAAKAAEAAGSAEVAWASAATFGFAEAAAIAKANRSYGALIIIATYVFIESLRKMQLSEHKNTLTYFWI